MPHNFISKSQGADPNLTAFSLFCQDMYRGVSKYYERRKGKTYKVVWENMTDEEKEPYFEKEKRLKEERDAEKPPPSKKQKRVFPSKNNIQKEIPPVIHNIFKERKKKRIAEIVQEVKDKLAIDEGIPAECGNPNVIEIEKPEPAKIVSTKSVNENSAPLTIFEEYEKLKASLPPELPKNKNLNHEKCFQPRKCIPKFFEYERTDTIGFAERDRIRKLELFSSLLEKLEEEHARNAEIDISWLTPCFAPEEPLVAPPSNKSSDLPATASTTSESSSSSTIPSISPSETLSNPVDTPSEASSNLESGTTSESNFSTAFTTSESFSETNQPGIATKSTFTTLESSNLSTLPLSISPPEALSNPVDIPSETSSNVESFESDVLKAPTTFESSPVTNQVGSVSTLQSISQSEVDTPSETSSDLECGKTSESDVTKALTASEYPSESSSEPDHPEFLSTTVTASETLLSSLDYFSDLNTLDVLDDLDCIEPTISFQGIFNFQNSSSTSTFSSVEFLHSTHPQSSFTLPSISPPEALPSLDYFPEFNTSNTLDDLDCIEPTISFQGVTSSQFSEYPSFGSFPSFYPAMDSFDIDIPDYFANVPPYTSLFSYPPESFPIESSLPSLSSETYAPHIPDDFADITPTMFFSPGFSEWEHFYL
ncbi:hypothetical protein CRE_13650 [Caenorhabditis remanei]|uniref:Uncharacterized protein n=1 Tax=Caenorhabditis remanei TaxID=31234 RepID=E3N1H2_CAERE|nr:hypothetical protein CRE_13650 [Caenorhabditis remanei]